MSIQGKGKYIGKRKIEIDQDLDLSPDTEIFYVIEEIKPVHIKKQNNEPLKDCFAGLVDPDIDLEVEIKKARKEIQESLDKKFKNWNT